MKKIKRNTKRNIRKSSGMDLTGLIIEPSEVADIKDYIFEKLSDPTYVPVRRKQTESAPSFDLGLIGFLGMCF